jgi:hypothetical protein
LRHLESLPDRLVSSNMLVDCAIKRADVHIQIFAQAREVEAERGAQQRLFNAAACWRPRF